MWRLRQSCSNESIGGPTCSRPTVTMQLVAPLTTGGRRTRTSQYDQQRYCGGTSSDTPSIVPKTTELRASCPATAPSVSASCAPALYRLVLSAALLLGVDGSKSLHRQVAGSYRYMIFFLLALPLLGAFLRFKHPTWPRLKQTRMRP